MNRVFVLYDHLYDATLSVHKSYRDAEKAIRKHLEGVVTQGAKTWWADFGPDGRLHQSPMDGKTFEQFLNEELEAAKKNLSIQEYELT